LQRTHDDLRYIAGVVKCCRLTVVSSAAVTAMTAIVLFVMTALVVASIVQIGVDVSEFTSWSPPSFVCPANTSWISLIYSVEMW
jgi:hypothetical protein